MEQNDRPFCRICLSTDRELQQQNIELFMDIVCNCRGTTGGIFHTCLEREIIIFNKWKCITCEQKYKHIEKICNNRWLDLIANILCISVTIYYTFVLLPIAFIELILSIIIRGKITIDIVFIAIWVMLNHRIDVSIACQCLFGRELIAIRVRVVKRRKCLSLLYHLLYRLVSNNTVRVIRRVILEI